MVEKESIGVRTADDNKVQRRHMARVGHSAEVRAFYTDEPTPAGIRAILQENNVRLHVVSSDGTGQTR